MRISIKYAGKDARWRAMYIVEIPLSEEIELTSAVKIRNPETELMGGSEVVKYLTVPNISLNYKRSFIGFEWRVLKIELTGNAPYVKGVLFLPAINRGRLYELQYKLFAQNYTGNYFTRNIDLPQPQTMTSSARRSAGNDDVELLFNKPNTSLYQHTTPAVYAVYKSGLSGYIVGILIRLNDNWSNIQSNSTASSELKSSASQVTPGSLVQVTTEVLEEIYCPSPGAGNERGSFIPYKVKYTAIYGDNITLVFTWDVIKDTLTNAGVTIGQETFSLPLSKILKIPVLQDSKTRAELLSFYKKASGEFNSVELSEVSVLRNNVEELVPEIEPVALSGPSSDIYNGLVGGEQDQRDL